MTTTLAEARAEFWYTAEREGMKCPCCDRWGKIRRAGLGSSQARSLLGFYALQVEHGPGEWINWHDVQLWLLDRGMQIATSYGWLKHWDMLEPKPHIPDKTKTAGLWRVTARGREFALGDLSAPSHAIIYNDRRLRYDGDMITIAQAAQKEFNYSEMMREWALPRDDARAYLW